MKKLNLEEVLQNTSELKEKKLGFVSILGRPNVGKSSFVNKLIGEKVSIITNIPQTTRKKIMAIYNDEDSQIIFFDTPGIHKGEKKINNYINSQATSSIKNSDIVLYFIDSSRCSGEEEKYINDILKNLNIPLLKVYTKIDLAPKIIMIDSKNTFKISSINMFGFKELISHIKKNLPKSMILFPEDIYTKQDIYFRISEIIREKVFLQTKDEIPHSVFVGVEEIDDKNDIMKISSYIYTESDSQKYILIGKDGNLISSIGKQARLELEKIFEKKVFLGLRVKVKKNWRKNEKLFKNI